MYFRKYFRTFVFITSGSTFIYHVRYALPSYESTSEGTKVRVALLLRFYLLRRYEGTVGPTRTTMYEIKYFRKYLRSKVSCQLISENSRQGLHTIVQYIVYLCTKVYYRNRIVRHQSCYLRSLRYNQISLAKSTKFVCVYGINRKKRTFVRAHAPSLRELI